VKNDDVVAALAAYMLLAMREAGESFVKVEYRRNAIVYLYAASSQVSIFADGDVITIKSDDLRTPEELGGLRPDDIEFNVHPDNQGRVSPGDLEALRMTAKRVWYRHNP